MPDHLDLPTLEAAAEGEWPPERRRWLEAHLADCPMCRAQAARHRRLATLAAHLPSEPAPADLVRRIVRAVAARRHNRALWRGLSSATLASGLLGLTLLVISLPDMAAAATLALQVAEVGDLASPIGAWLAAPFETLAAWGQMGLNWYTGLTESAGAAFLLGLVLLATAAFGGLAQALHASPQG